MTMKWGFVLAALWASVGLTAAWFDAEDLEIFDLVEEVNRNFYEFMELNETATSSEIKRQFRILSLRLHPDKNKAPDAELQFRHLVAISEILRDEQKRKKYDDVLVNGLPNWKTGIYYYRRVRKLGIAEMLIIVSVILTIGHYLCLLASYWEKNLDVQQMIKKKERKLKNSELDQLRLDLLEQLGYRYPNWKTDLLPIQFAALVTRLIFDTPAIVKSSATWIFSKWEERRTATILEEEEEDEEEARPKKSKPKPFDLPDYSDLYDADEMNKSTANETDVNKTSSTDVESQPWSESDIHLLVKLCKKYPSGMHKKWDHIACALQRSVEDVTRMAKNIKNGVVQLNNVAAAQTSSFVSSSSVLTAANDVTVRDDVQNVTQRANQEQVSGLALWTQEQQQALESALVKYPKGIDERWEKIAEMIPGKTKDECIARFKVLVDKVRQKRMKSD